LGFDACATGSVCAATSPGSAYSTCQNATAVRTSQCSSAPFLVLEHGHASYTGVADGASLWDAPSGCSPNDPRDRPEAVVLMTLTQDAAHVVITTDTPQTSFDTTVYLVPGCMEPGSDALVCADDGADTVASTLNVQSLPAGTYAIVVDSFGAGGSFGLDVTVE
jgi:hypothetical protein